MNYKFFSFAIPIILLLSIISSNAATIKGTVLQKSDKSPLSGASVTLLNPDSKTIVKGAYTNAKGQFTIESLAQGKYIINVKSLGFANYESNLNLNSDQQNIKPIELEQSDIKLDDINVEARQVRAEQQGDTTIYNADAFKVNRDASAEDLVSKMPGITNDGGQVTAQGEQVRKVLIDGKEFMGEDANAALKSLPAEIIDKVSVFDLMSEQSRFTGFDDGRSVKAMNITTKQDKNKGEFGRISTAYGTDGRYTGNLNLNLFSPQRRISIIGLTNNVNQQNFSMDDIVGAIGSGGGGGGRFRGMARGTSARGGDAGNFMVGQQGGITETHALGVNYTEDIGGLKMAASYFFNYGDNVQENNLVRNFFLGNSIDNNNNYIEESRANSININHRFNARMEYDIDSSNSMVFTPKLSYQDARNNSLSNGINSVNPNNINNIENDNNSDNQAINFSSLLTYRHKFEKPGRTISMNLENSYRKNEGINGLNSFSFFTDFSDTLLQRTNLNGEVITLEPEIQFTEKISESGMLQLEYSPVISTDKTKRFTNQLDNDNQDIQTIDPQLSIDFENKINTQKVELSYRYNEGDLSFMFGSDYQYTNLIAQTTFPGTFQVERNFENFLPRLMFNYKVSQSKSIRFFMRSYTILPNAGQLQDVVDNSNPLFLSTGNSGLNQERSLRSVLRYGSTDWKDASSFFAFVFVNYSDDFIGNQRIIASEDTISLAGIMVAPGQQLTRPTNLNGFYNIRSMINYGLPLDVIKSNINFNGGVNFSSTPSLINSEKNTSENRGINFGMTLSSNISQEIDFTLSYNGSANQVRNTIIEGSNNDFYNHTISVRYNWLLWDRLTLNTNVFNAFNNGLNEGFNVNYWLWNASVAYRLFDDIPLELKLSVFDILGQNNSISRTVTETFIEDFRQNVLSQYFMLTLTYNLRNFYGIGDNSNERPMRGNRMGGTY